MRIPKPKLNSKLIRRIIVLGFSLAIIASAIAPKPDRSPGKVAGTTANPLLLTTPYEKFCDNPNSPNQLGCTNFISPNLVQATNTTFQNVDSPVAITGTLSVGLFNAGMQISSGAGDNFHLRTYTNTPNPNWDLGYGNGAGGLDTTKEYIVSNAGKINFMNTKVGIGIATTPGERLEVNGAIKFTGDGSVISKSPRIVHTEDPVSGCPPARAAGTDLFTQSLSLTRSANVFISASIIRAYSGRADLGLYVDGVSRDVTLTYTPSSQWEDAHVQWSGVLAAGNHTVSLRGGIANIWGCGSGWGSIDSIIFE